MVEWLGFPAAASLMGSLPETQLQDMAPEPSYCLWSKLTGQHDAA